MRKHVVVFGTAVAVTAAALLTQTLPVDAQGRRGGGAAPGAQAAPAAYVPQRAATLKRLPDGTPDIRGTWVRVGGGMNEANAPDSELKAFGVLSEPQGFGQGLVTAGPEGGLAKARPPSAYIPNPRPPQGIVDPANRQLPYTAEGRAKRLDYAKNMCCPAKNLSYLELSVRCAPPQPWAGGGVNIFEKPGEISLLFEQNHQSRIFYTDGRPHPSPDVTFLGGHSTAHWQGTHLLVDTTNLDGRAYYGVGNTFAPFSRQLHITEDFDVISDKLITFIMTYDDPKTFTRPIKVAGYLYPQDPAEELTPEFTCHEGSYALPDIFGF